MTQGGGLTPNLIKAMKLIMEDDKNKDFPPPQVVEAEVVPNGIELIFQDENIPLEELERRIRNGLKEVYSVGFSLIYIKDNKLYKQLNYRTFEAYARERWGMTKSLAYRFIAAAITMANLIKHKQSLEKNVANWRQNEPLPDWVRLGILPNNESQLRPITRYEAPVQCTIWEKAVAKMGQKLPTAKVVKETAIEVMQEIEQQQTPEIDETPPLLAVGDICFIQAKDETALKRYSGLPCAIKTKNEHSYDIDVFDRTLELIKPEYLIKQDYSESDRAAAIALLARLQKIAAIETVSRAINVILLEFGSRLIFPISDRDEEILSFIENRLGISHN